MSTIRRGAFVLAVLILAGSRTGSVSLAQDRPADPPARVYKAKPGQFLAARANTTPPGLVADFLRARGASDATARSLRGAGEHRSVKTGMKHLRLEQEVAGLRVPDAYVKATFAAVRVPNHRRLSAPRLDSGTLSGFGKSSPGIGTTDAVSITRVGPIRVVRARAR